MVFSVGEFTNKVWEEEEVVVVVAAAVSASRNEPSSKLAIPSIPLLDKCTTVVFSFFKTLSSPASRLLDEFIAQEEVSTLVSNLGRF